MTTIQPEPTALLLTGDDGTLYAAWPAVGVAGQVYLSDTGVCCYGDDGVPAGAVPLYGLTAPPDTPPAGLLPAINSSLIAAIRASLAATRVWLDEHKASGTPIPDRAGEAEPAPAVAALTPPSAPSSTAAPRLLGTGSAGAAVGPNVGAGGAFLARPAGSGSNGGAT